MVASFSFTIDSRIPLTSRELATLKAFVDAGDRGGFYMAYYAMTGNSEALLTAQISTFSQDVCVSACKFDPVRRGIGVQL